MGVTTSTANAGATYTPIATYTAPSSVSGYTFSSIPSTYTDLRLIISAKAATAQGQIYININGDSGSNYSRTILYGTGSAASSNRSSNQTLGYLDYYGVVETTFNNINITDFLNYSNTTTYKTYLNRANDASSGVDATVSLWRATPAAINQIAVTLSGSQFASGTTMTLYGIRGA